MTNVIFIVGLLRYICQDITKPIMITVGEAVQLVKRHSVMLNSQGVKKMIDAVGYVLCDDVYASVNMPPFRQSAMDGYALCLHDSDSYSLVGEVKAGDAHRPYLKKGDAVRIFTGSVVPDTADAVVMQEKAAVRNKTLKIERPVFPGDHIRPLGEQVKKGAVALKKGTVLTPAAIGYLSSLGITSVCVFEKPSITIVVTGNELVEAGKPLTYGSIYESNSVMLSSALGHLGYPDISVNRVADSYTDILRVLNSVIPKNDVVLITGGISVGDYDFVGRVLDELCVTQLFYKVKQKPGKPLFFGRKKDSLIFALPGNPAAVLSCFYVYVYPTLQRMSGLSDFDLKKSVAISDSSFTKKGDRTQFLKAILKNGTVTILEGQGSAMLHTFSLANALVYVPENKSTISKGDEVEVIHLPNLISI